MLAQIPPFMNTDDPIIISTSIVLVIFHWVKVVDDRCCSSIKLRCNNTALRDMNQKFQTQQREGNEREAHYKARIRALELI